MSLFLSSAPSLSLPLPRRFGTVRAHASCQSPTLVAERSSASLYEVLRVEHTASPTEIKTAYRTLAKVYHPDAADSDSDGRDFIEIHNAYATLYDPAARALYDLSMGPSDVRSFRRASVSRSEFYPTRRWETDQCW